MSLNRRKIYKDYCFYKKAAFEASKRGNIEMCLNAITGCVELAYRFYIKDTYGDKELEDLLYNIGKQYINILPEKYIKNYEEKKIIFYDSFAQDNRGLTEQYIDALHYNGFNVLFITTNENFSKDTKLGNKIINEYQYSYKIIDKEGSYVKKINELTSIISKFDAKKIFLHLSPFDLLAIIVFSQYKGILYRYFINITDHAYWLGKNCIDECIEFRKFGVALSAFVRDISINKISLLPYFPVSESIVGSDDNHKILENFKDKFVVITGGTNYKYLDADYKLLNLILRLFDENSNVVLVMIGTDYAGELYKKIAEGKGYMGRIFLLKSTPYLESLLQLSDLYLCSYPMTGGLMAQIAVKQGLPIMSYTDKYIYHNDISDLLNNKEFKIHTSYGTFCRQFNLLVRDKKYREDYVNSFKEKLCNETDFQKNILDVLYKKVYLNSSDYKNIYPKIKSLARKNSSIYIDTENKINKSYSTTIMHYDKLLNIKPKMPIRKKIKSYLERKIAIFIRIGQRYIDNQNFEMVLSLFNRIGKNVKIMAPYSIYGQWNILIGDNFSAQRNLWLEAIDKHNDVMYTPKIIIGKNVSLQNNCHIAAINSIIIGDNVLMGSNILITDHFHGKTTTDELQISPNSRNLYSKGDVSIGNNVWIGDNVVIMPNVKIGNGCIIGAGSIVTHSFDDNAVIAGNPAKRVNVK